MEVIDGGLLEFAIVSNAYPLVLTFLACLLGLLAVLRLSDQLERKQPTVSAGPNRAAASATGHTDGQSGPAAISRPVAVMPTPNGTSADREEQDTAAPPATALDGRAPAPQRGENDEDEAAEPSEEDLAALMDAARARLDLGDADGALGFALAAVKISNGGDMQAIGRALDAAKTKAAADRARVMQERPELSEKDASMVAAADAVRDDMLTRESLLGDGGRSGVLREAIENGSSVVCIRCGQLIARARTEAHRTMWCPLIEDEDVTDDEAKLS
eukprot:m.467883 g.467883  ORF g.467883 m.467883 type:complete len:273 (-) comp26966_c0_seq1:283-1101(-)